MNRAFFTAVVVLSAMLSGCAQTVTRIEMKGVDKSISIPVSDLRPDNEKKSETFSFLITSSAYAIYRKGDETLDPPMTQLFRRKAFDKLGSKGNLKITIHHMVSYMNAKAQLRAGAIGGVIGAVIASKSSVNLSQSVVNRKDFEAANNEEHRRAFYTKSENPDNATVFVIYIDADINGKRTFIKTMSPVTAPKGQDAYALAVQSTIDYFLSKY